MVTGLETTEIQKNTTSDAKPTLFNSISEKDWQAYNTSMKTGTTDVRPGAPGATEPNSLTFTPLPGYEAASTPVASNSTPTDSTTTSKSTQPHETVTSLISQWEAARKDGTTLTNPTTPLQTDFNTGDGKTYHDDMNARLNTLTTDAASAKANDPALATAIKNVDTDAQWWTTHEKGNAATSQVVADMNKETGQMQQAETLINQGKTAEGQALLKSSAADVKDDLNTLQQADWLQRHGYDGGGGGTGPTKDTQTFSNLGADSWHYNTQDKSPPGKPGTGIGGEGNDPQIQTSYKDGVLTYTTTGGKYSDSLISNGQKFNPDANTFTLNYSMNRDAATAGNEQASEHDMVITDNTGMQAQAASQFNYSEKAPAGYTWFQTSDTNGNWVNAALVPTPKPGEYTDVSMQVKLIGNNQYEYTGLNINGQSYALNPDATTFKMHQSDWTHNEVVTQLQEDTNDNGGPITQYYKNISVSAGVS
jgi:hypothetical protein